MKTFADTTTFFAGITVGVVIADDLNVMIAIGAILATWIIRGVRDASEGTQ